MSLIVLDIELAEKNVVKELGVYIDGQVFGYSFKPPKKYQPTHQTFWCTQNLHKIDWKSGSLDYSRINTMLAELRQYRAEYFVKGLEKCKVLSTLLGKEVENLDDYGCPKIQHLNTDWCALAIPTDTGQFYIVLSGKQKRLENGLCNISICKFIVCLCITHSYYFKLFVQPKFFPQEIHS